MATRPGPPASALKGCPVIVWDGPYSFRCGAGASVGHCFYHGPFDPSLIRVDTPSDACLSFEGLDSGPCVVCARPRDEHRGR